MVPAGSDLTGRVALVTGGSRGLGRAMVLAFAERGADVVVSSRKAAACEALAEEVRERFAVRAQAIACHVGRWQEVDALAEQAYAAMGRIDVLVNNAGMSPLYDDVTAVSEELWDKVIAVNLKGAFRLTAVVGSRMVADGGGSIINVSSVGAVRPTPDVIPYAAAKAGLNAMTVAFARAFGPTVRVNAILPGTFLTDIADAWDMETYGAMAERFALRRFAQPEEIAGTAVYLASAASSYTTGALIRVDGGVP